ncbi:MAG TPA: hypothetical protein DHU96_26570 [Actinobacteria bacterium]|nr:hypothetical protein [Actinomycetota bacterium]
MGGQHEAPGSTDPMMGVVILALLAILAAVVLLALAGDWLITVMTTAFRRQCFQPQSTGGGRRGGGTDFAFSAAF